MNIQQDRYGRAKVAVTGISLITALGETINANWQKLIEGHSAIKKITRFNTDKLATKIGGCIENIPQCQHGAYVLTEYLAYKAIANMLTTSEPFNAPLFMALPPMELSWEGRLASEANKEHKILYNTIQNNIIPYKLKKLFNFSGCPTIVNTACASGATAINLAYNHIAHGKSKKAMIVAADGSVTPELITRFSLLGALARENDYPEQASKPFMKDRSGFVIAEGAAAICLETLETALENNKKIYALIAGGGETTDGFHRTRPSPDNKAAIKAIQLALKDANLVPEQIDHINAHATSTIENDKAEYYAMHTVFGDSLKTISLTANKSMLGHSLCAAGAIEAVIAILSLHNSICPPTINYGNIDPNICLNIVANKARPQNIQHILSNSFGFGGQNSCLIFSKFQKV